MKWLKWLAGLAVLGVLVLVLGVYFTADLRWRGALLVDKTRGLYPEANWSEFTQMLRPGSGFWLADLRRHSTLYAVVHNPHDTKRDFEAGRKRFEEFCSRCHGAGGTGGVAPALVGRISSRTESDWATYRTLRDGIPGTAMAPMDIGWKEIWQVAGYVRTLSVAGSEPAQLAGPLGTLAPVPASRIEASDSTPQDWLTYAGNYLGHHYSKLNLINRENVGRLRMEWMYQPLSDFRRIEATPLVADGLMFVAMAPADVAAIDPTTGKELWRHAGRLPADFPAGGWRVSRGVALLDDAVFVATLDGSVKALDAKTGAVRWRKVLADYRHSYAFTAAPLAVKDMVIIGSSGGDSPTRGFIVALDAKTGAERWRFHTVPGSGEPGSDTWKGDSWKTGGAAPWATGSYDAALGRLYWGTGNPAPDHVGSVREGDNLYANSIVALDVATGKLAWYFQFTPHDLHDWDSTQVPVIMPASDGSDGGRILFANRNGFYYTLDRKTGKYLGATPFVKQTWAKSIDDKGRPTRAPEAVPSPAGAIVYPSAEGGTNWWPQSFDPTSKLIYVPFLERGGIFYSTDPVEPKPGQLYMLGSSRGLSGELFHAGVKAIEAETGRIVWTTQHEPRADEAETGGLLATGGGIVFGADYFRLFALDASNGKTLWQVRTGGEIASAAMTYLVNGRQYLAIPSGRVVLGFALPQDDAMPALTTTAAK